MPKIIKKNKLRFVEDMLKKPQTVNSRLTPLFTLMRREYTNPWHNLHTR